MHTSMLLYVYMEYLKESFKQTHSIGKTECDVIYNPHRILSENEKDGIALSLNKVMRRTTGVDRDVEEVRKYALGRIDGGRTLFVFRDRETIVGFSSFHLLNDGNDFIRYNDKTILHLGSGHIDPEYQGRRLAYSSIGLFLKTVGDTIRPQYVEGFTQSPRLLSLVDLTTRHQMIPAPNKSELYGELVGLQSTVLDHISASMKLTHRDSCIVQGINEQVYSEPIMANSPFDDLVYNKLKLDTKKGEFVHFVAKL